MPSTPRAVSDYDDEWILANRPPKNPVDPSKPYTFLMEEEATPDGRVEPVATIFLTNSECPFRCLMCDLWKNTTDEPVASGMIRNQIEWALERLPPAKHIKLYNSGNFFDPSAIPENDYASIAEAVSRFDSVIVESHPRMIGRRCFAFNDMVEGAVQVAMGLETVCPEVLSKLNKQMTLDDFAGAVERLRRHDMTARAFILLKPPFMDEREAVSWAKRSLDFAFHVGVECCAIIPTRGGNGAMEVLENRGEFSPPSLDSLEEVIDYGIGLKKGRVFADLWDIENAAGDAPGAKDRIDRLREINLTQQPVPRLRQ